MVTTIKGLELRRNVAVSKPARNPGVFRGVQLVGDDHSIEESIRHVGFVERFFVLDFGAPLTPIYRWSATVSSATTTVRQACLGAGHCRYAGGHLPTFF